jgi:hypothetical protein
MSLFSFPLERKSRSLRSKQAAAIPFQSNENLQKSHEKTVFQTGPKRRRNKTFEGVGEKHKEPLHHDGKLVFSILEDLKVVFGKGSGRQSVPNDKDGHAPMWKKSIFWKLTYWEVLEVWNVLDVMHVVKNFCVNLLGHLGVYGKTKDTIEAR